VFKFDKTAPGGFKWGFQLDNDPDRICFSKLYVQSLIFFSKTKSCVMFRHLNFLICSLSKRAKNVSYLDPAQIVAAETLATFSTKLGKLPPNRKATDGISKFLEAIRAVAVDRMESEWGKGCIPFHPLRSQSDFDRFRGQHANRNHFDSPSCMV
jgi:hypothetical protein